MGKGLIAKLIKLFTVRKRHKALITDYRTLSLVHDINVRALAKARVDLNQKQIDFELLKMGYKALKKELEQIKGIMMNGTNPKVEVFA